MSQDLRNLLQVVKQHQQLLHYRYVQGLQDILLSQHVHRKRLNEQQGKQDIHYLQASQPVEDNNIIKYTDQGPFLMCFNHNCI